MALKHIGRLTKTGRKVAVAFRTLPDDPEHCLVVQTENLSDQDHDTLMNLIESNAGQTAEELADAMQVSMLLEIGVRCLRLLQTYVLTAARGEAARRRSAVALRAYSAQPFLESVNIGHAP